MLFGIRSRKYDLDFFIFLVLKSDNANGLFGFEGLCQPLQVVTEGSSFSCVVRRERGDAGNTSTVQTQQLSIIQYFDPMSPSFVNCWIIIMLS